MLARCEPIDSPLPGCCPILYVYDGDWTFETLLGIGGDSDIVLNHSLATFPEIVVGSYMFRLVENGTISYIDQVKLYATLAIGPTIELPLFEATHSEYGSVLLDLLFSDDVRTDIATGESIDLKFVGLPTYIEVDEFTFQIEGYSPT